MTLNCIPTDAAGNVCRTASAETIWLPNDPFYATLVMWAVINGRYLVLRNMATGLTYPVTWAGWWPMDSTDQNRHPVFLGTRQEWRQCAAHPDRVSTHQQRPLPADCPLQTHGWASRGWCQSWQGWWVVTRQGRGYGLRYLGSGQEQVL